MLNSSHCLTKLIENIYDELFNSMGEEAYNIIKKRLNQKVIVYKLQSDKVEQCIYKQGRINITKEMFYE